MAGRYPIITLTNSQYTVNMFQYGHCSKARGHILAGTDPSLLALLEILNNTPVSADVSAAPSFLILQHLKSRKSLRTLTLDKLLSPTQVNSDETGESLTWPGLNQLCMMWSPSLHID